MRAHTATLALSLAGALFGCAGVLAKGPRLPDAGHYFASSFQDEVHEHFMTEALRETIYFFVQK
jgi:hypothetical protein